jgi:hypothetical protein
MSKEDLDYFNECENEHFEGLTVEEKAQYIRTMLKVNVMEFEYTKKDGTERKLRGTMISTYLPENDSTSTRQSSVAIPVWDLDAEGWRSILPEGVRKLNIVA